MNTYTSTCISYTYVLCVASFSRLISNFEARLPRRNEQAMNEYSYCCSRTTQKCRTALLDEIFTI